MPYNTNLYNKGTGLSFIPFSITNDIFTLKSQYLTLNSNYTNTSNLGNDLKISYSNLKVVSSNNGVFINSNLVINNFSLNTASLTLNNGDTGPTDVKQPQMKFSWKNNDELAYNHYIRTCHSLNDYNNRIDFLLCDGTRGNDMNTGVSNILTLTGAGNVGIGTTNPLYTLDVRGTGNFSSNLIVGGTGNFSGNISSSNFSGTTTFSDPTTTFGSVNITGTSRGTYLGYIINNDSGYVNSSLYTGIYDFLNSRWAFYQVRANGNLILGVVGNVGIGITNPTYKLQLSTDSAAKPGTNTWTIASDSRLKTDIEVADYDRCYNIMSNLDLKKYSWRDDIEGLGSNFIKDRSKLGWIADDVKLYYPKAVNIIPEAYGLSNVLDLNTDSIYACMYGSIKKLMELCEAYHASIEELEKRINYLEI